MRYFLVFLIFLSNLAYAQSVSGSMDCTVTGSVVIASEEGQFKTYPNIQGGVKANEKLTLNYEVRSNSINISLNRDKIEKETVTTAFMSTNLNKDITVAKGHNGGYVLTENNFKHSISFLPDYIRIKEFREFFISRYYKNDWHGIFSNVNSMGSFSQTLTLNCRHTNDNMDAAFRIFTGSKK
jgi:hypothetical protein